MPEVTQIGLFDIQVCVPADWNDEQVKEFAEREAPCGTSNGWQIRKQGSEYLAGCDERVPCESRAGFVHIMLNV